MHIRQHTRLALSALGVTAMSFAFAGPSHAAVTLVEVDFSGTGNVGTIASSDSQFTTKNAAVTFDDTAATLAAIGGGLSTSGWVYDGTATAAANPDLFTSSTFGAPTRFDLDLGVAASGFSYTITRAEIDVRASISSGTNWDFMYRKPDNSTVILAGGAIANQGGADPITTYAIDLPTTLTATDSDTDWNVSGTGELRFAFYDTSDGANNDNLQIDAIRLIGTAVPEPSSLALLGLGGLAMIRRRR